MALPTLSKAGVTTVVISKAPTFPGAEPLTMNQFVGVSDDNTIRVFSLGPAKRTLQLVFEQLTTLDRVNIEAFFNNLLVNWGVNDFTYTDENGTATIVRNLQPEFAPQLLSDDNWSVTLVFTVV